jgi:hypothetical protein
MYVFSDINTVYVHISECEDMISGKREYLALGSSKRLRD